MVFKTTANIRDEADVWRAFSMDFPCLGLIDSPNVADARLNLEYYKYFLFTLLDFTWPRQLFETVDAFYMFSNSTEFARSKRSTSDVTLDIQPSFQRHAKVWIDLTHTDSSACDL